MTGSIQINKKDGKYYIYLSWKQGNKRKQKCIGTGLPAKGRNKRRAEAALQQALTEWRDRIVEDQPDIFFSDYLTTWLSDIKNTVQPTTYSNYRIVVDGVIRPYFAERGIRLQNLSPRHIQDFYTLKMERDGVSPNTIRHYHSYINSALKHAIDMEMIKVNPAERVKLPKKVKYRAVAHDASSIGKLIEGSKGTRLEAPIRIGALFGTRRGEILGVKWRDIDLDKKRLYIGSVIAKADQEYYKQTSKNETSIRWFPLSDDDVEFFINLKNKQKANRARYGDRYNTEDKDFVCVDEYGNRLKLDYLTRNIPKLAIKLGLDRIKLHELRHSNISLLLASGASINEVQEWAGHSSASTTANIYGHTLGEYKTKLTETIHNSLNEPSTS